MRSSSPYIRRGPSVRLYPPPLRAIRGFAPWGSGKAATSPSVGQLCHWRVCPVVWLELDGMWRGAWSSDLADCWGVKRACSGSRLDPSPTEAKDLCFWLLIDRMKPLTMTFSLSLGPWSSRCAMDGSWDNGLVCKPFECWNSCLTLRATAGRTISPHQTGSDRSLPCGEPSWGWIVSVVRELRGIEGRW
jgi:hypothetical protein